MDGTAPLPATSDWLVLIRMKISVLEGDMLVECVKSMGQEDTSRPADESRKADEMANKEHQKC